MKVLIACEESQAICYEFRFLGHEAYSCDLQECSGGYPQWHIQGDVLPIINGRCEFTTMDGSQHEILDRWDMIIAHPPCTYLTSSGACRLYINGSVSLDRYEKGLLAKDFFMQIYNADCDKICIENPTPLHIYNLPRYSQIIQPYMFGDYFTKRTCLWLKGLPFLSETNNLGKPDTVTYIRKNGSKHYKCWTQSQHSAIARSKTFPGIAKAIAEQFSYFEDFQIRLF